MKIVLLKRSKIKQCYFAKKLCAWSEIMLKIMPADSDKGEKIFIGAMDGFLGSHTFT